MGRTGQGDFSLLEGKTEATGGRPACPERARTASPPAERLPKLGPGELWRDPLLREMGDTVGCRAVATLHPHGQQHVGIAGQFAKAWRGRFPPEDSRGSGARTWTWTAGWTPSLFLDRTAWR